MVAIQLYKVLLKATLWVVEVLGVVTRTPKGTSLNMAEAVVVGVAVTPKLKRVVGRYSVPVVAVQAHGLVAHGAITTTAMVELLQGLLEQAEATAVAMVVVATITLEVRVVMGAHPEVEAAVSVILVAAQ